jgi:uncharacterized Zn finger protein
MKAEHRPLVDIDALRERAGAKVFARGAAYHRDGRMATLRPKAEQVTYVLALKERFGRRRNFTKLLE